MRPRRRVAVAESAELQSSSPQLICPVGGLARGESGPHGHTVDQQFPPCRRGHQPRIAAVRQVRLRPSQPGPTRCHRRGSDRAVRSSSPETCQTLLSLVAAAVQEADHSRHERFRFGSLNRPHLRWRVCAPKRWLASKPDYDTVTWVDHAPRPLRAGLARTSWD
jgi:hypothetical protein